VGPESCPLWGDRSQVKFHRMCALSILRLPCQCRTCKSVLSILHCGTGLTPQFSSTISLSPRVSPLDQTAIVKDSPESLLSYLSQSHTKSAGPEVTSLSDRVENAATSRWPSYVALLLTNAYHFAHFIPCP
jgi:hypothetical protein